MEQNQMSEEREDKVIDLSLDSGLGVAENNSRKGNFDSLKITSLEKYILLVGDKHL